MAEQEVIVAIDKIADLSIELGNSGLAMNDVAGLMIQSGYRIMCLAQGEQAAQFFLQAYLETKSLPESLTGGGSNARN